MKNSLLLIMVLSQFLNAGAQAPVYGMEQYCYFGKGEQVSLVSIGYYQNANNWYGEVRYNYEEQNTLSMYAGKTFYWRGGFSGSVTPMIGLLAGGYTGGSLGANLLLAYKDVTFSSQSQYLVSKDGRNTSFFLNWSELGVAILPCLRSGIALQQSTVFHSSPAMEAGLFATVSYKNWELPVYVFSPASGQRNYVIGISWEWQHYIKRKNQEPLPSVKGRTNLALE